jgi:hypothetical protein
MPNSGDLRLSVERVTGIEPAWPAWKAGGSKPDVRRSLPRKEDAVPSACLTATLGGARDDGDADSAVAQLLQCGLLRPSFVPPPPEIQRLRMLTAGPDRYDADNLLRGPDHRTAPSGDDPTDVWSGLADATPDDGAIPSCRAEPRRDRVMARRLVRAHDARLPVRGLGGVVR